MGWRELGSGETNAATLRSALVAEGFCVEISKETGSAIVYHNGATPLKQTETVTVVEFRGLAPETAKKLVELENDGSTTAVLYSRRSTASAGTSQYVAAVVRSGSVVKVTAQRSNDSGGWCVRETTTIYGYIGTGWTATRPTDSSTTGTVISKAEKAIATPYDGGVKTQTVTETVTEYQFLTYAEATALCSSSNTMLATRAPYTYTRTVDGVARACVGYYTYLHGAVTGSVMRYIDEVNGWTVTKTTTVTSG